MPTITITLDTSDPTTLRVLDVLGLRRAPEDIVTLRSRLVGALAQGPAKAATIRARLDADGHGGAEFQVVANGLQRLKKDGLAALDPATREWRYLPEGEKR